MNLDDAISQLRDRLERHPPERFPVQHATAQFHLGQALLQSGDADQAVAALRASLRWFPEALEAERAKVLNLLGAALRTTGTLDAAAACFTEAAQRFAVRGLTAERGAAVFNLGLVRRDVGDARAAVDAFAQARELFAGGPLAPQGTAALHHGTALLEAGDVDGAAAALQQALDLAKRVAEREAVGAAANALGLAQLAAQRPREAVDAFGLAVAAHPRSVRPGEFAMAKANLALAYEATDDVARARLAARQALAVDRPPDAVRAQAEAILERLGPASGSDLLAVLDTAPADQWPSTVRDELVRWAAAPAVERRGEAAAWITGLFSRPDRTEELAEAWLRGLVELPPGDLDAVVVAALQAGDDVDPAAAERFRSVTARMMAVFPVPQLLRLRDRFHDLAAGLGQHATWS